MSSLRVFKDDKVDNVTVNNSQVLPYIRSSAPPPNLVNGVGGGLSYDTLTNKVYYNNGSAWIPISVAVTGLTAPYSFVKSIPQAIAPSSSTILTNWTTLPSPPYLIISGWNLTAGVYTASVPQNLDINVDIAWASGNPNDGSRTVRVIYFNLAGPTLITAKELTTQPAADTTMETPQVININLAMSAGDQAWVEVQHTSSSPQTIVSGSHSTVNGYSVATS